MHYYKERSVCLVGNGKATFEEMEKISVMKLAREQVSQLLLLLNQKSQLIIPIHPFLSLCNSLLHVLDKIGPTMGVLSQEIRQNIQRLELELDDGGGSGTDLVEILKKEANQGTAKTGTSCSRAFLWLTRSLDFTMALLEKISNEPGMNMDQAVEESYHVTLKPWHGWISSAAYKIALKLVPDRRSLINILMENEEKYETLVEDIHSFIPLLSAFLEEAHSILRLYNLDRIKSK